MRTDLLALLACPQCRGDLTLFTLGSTDTEQVESGSLQCASCDMSYEIIRGIPRFEPEEIAGEIAAHFSQEFSALAERDRDMDPPDVLRYFFYSRSGIAPDIYEAVPGDPYRTSLPPGTENFQPTVRYLKDKVCLDAGCGPGRFTRVAAQEGAARVVGLELGHHVERAARRCKDLTNVDFVQGSVLRPPFKRECFHYIYSLGVLHHTPDPSRSFNELSRLLARGGGLSVWVYPKQYWGGPVREPVSKLIHAALSRIGPRNAFRVCKWVLLPVGRVQRFLARRRWTKLLASPLFILNIPRHPDDDVMLATIFDYFASPLISTHSYEEVRGWFERNGLGSLRQIPIPVGYFGQRDA